MGSQANDLLQLLWVCIVRHRRQRLIWRNLIIRPILCRLSWNRAVGIMLMSFMVSMRWPTQAFVRIQWLSLNVFWIHWNVMFHAMSRSRTRVPRFVEEFMPLRNCFEFRESDRRPAFVGSTRHIARAWIFGGTEVWNAGGQTVWPARISGAVA